MCTLRPIKPSQQPRKMSGDARCAHLPVTHRWRQCRLQFASFAMQMPCHGSERKNRTLARCG
jgi:hypothetical protein